MAGWQTIKNAAAEGDLYLSLAINVWICLLGTRFVLLLIFPRSSRFWLHLGSALLGLSGLLLMFAVFVVGGTFALSGDTLVGWLLALGVVLVFAGFSGAAGVGAKRTH